MQAHGPRVFNVYHVNTHSYLYKTSDLQDQVAEWAFVSLILANFSEYDNYIYGQYCS